LFARWECGEHRRFGFFEISTRRERRGHYVLGGNFEPKKNPKLLAGLNSDDTILLSAVFRLRAFATIAPRRIDGLHNGALKEWPMQSFAKR
jgi:hypothetical protein